MEPARPEFVPDPALSREAMEDLQRDIAAAATFEDDFAFDPDAIGLSTSVEADNGGVQTRFGGGAGEEGGDETGETGGTGEPVVVGVDQAFSGDRAVSAIVALRGGRIVERVYAVAPLSIPYIPGLLSFREGGPILAAFEALDVEPDLALFDGSGRIHFRQAGLATHLGVTLDLPSVGVAKRLLCGRPREPVDDLPEGARVAIEADERVERGGERVERSSERVERGGGDRERDADDDRDSDRNDGSDGDGGDDADGGDDEDGELIGYALQTRQFPSSRRVNPVYVSPGHRVGEETAADVVLSLAAGYKLPEPIRLADRYVGEVRDSLETGN